MIGGKLDELRAGPLIRRPLPDRLRPFRHRNDLDPAQRLDLDAGTFAVLE